MLALTAFAQRTRLAACCRYHIQSGVGVVSVDGGNDSTFPLASLRPAPHIPTMVTISTSLAPLEPDSGRFVFMGKQGSHVG